MRRRDGGNTYTGSDFYPSFLAVKIRRCSCFEESSYLSLPSSLSLSLSLSFFPLQSGPLYHPYPLPSPPSIPFSSHPEPHPTSPIFISTQHLQIDRPDFSVSSIPRVLKLGRSEFHPGLICFTHLKMGSIDPPELSLDFRPSPILTPTVTAQQQQSYVPKTINDFIGEVSMTGDVQGKLLKLDDYVSKLDDEMRKIDAFKRELPLCMLLLNDAIRTLKEESTRYRKSANVEPVLEEFIPLKKTRDDEDEKDMVETKKENKDCRDKMSWMSSVQLWNSDNSSPKTDFQFNRGQISKPETKKRVTEEENQDDFFKSCKSQALARAFVPFKGCSGFPMTISSKEEGYELPGVPRLSLNTPGTKKPREDLDIGSGDLDSKLSAGRAVSCSAPSAQSNMRVVSQQQQPTSRKQRRCWSPELHRRFVDALQKLGGCQAATPKQIRELMQVDGLTNDEVKSHLQKYRLHTRRLPNTTSTTSSNQLVGILGGLWMPQEQNGESSKQSNSQSASPQCPLQLGGASRGTSMTGGDSMEDEEDEKSESHSWKSHILAS